MNGWSEKIECIQPVGVKGGNGEALCLAYKTGKFFVGGGVYLRDDGYVLGDPAAADRYYPWPDDATQVKAWQAQGLLPDPLPGYSVPASEYLAGYSLWLIVGVIVAVIGSIIGGRKLATKRRQALDAEVPISLGPPKLLTDGDRFIHSAATTLLQPSEVIQHQAFAVPEPSGAVGMMVVLTNLRVLVMVVDRPNLGAVLSSSSYLRSQVVDAREGSYEVTLVLADGSKRAYPVVPGEAEFSNQRAFVRDVPRMFAKKAVAGDAAMRALG